MRRWNFFSVEPHTPHATILIRFDAGPRIGWGHATRCVALADWALEAGWNVRLVTSRDSVLPPKALQHGDRVDRIGGEPGSKDDLEHLTDLAGKSGAAWIAVDGYHFSRDYVAALSSDTCSTIQFDDFGFSAPAASDLVLNQNPYASQSLYPRCTPEQVLAGPAFVLLRSEFWKWRDSPRIPSRPRRILVTFGGGDVLHLTESVISSVIADSRYSDRDFRLIVPGGRSPEHLRAPSHCALLENVADMAEQLAWADVVVGSFGTTLLEAMYMGVPGIWVKTNDTHVLAHAWLRESGLGIAIDGEEDDVPFDIAAGLDRMLDHSDLYSVIAERVRACVDGKGGDRIMRRLLEVSR